MNAMKCLRARWLVLRAIIRVLEGDDTSPRTPGGRFDKSEQGVSEKQISTNMDCYNIKTTKNTSDISMNSSHFVIVVYLNLFRLCGDKHQHAKIGCT